MKPPAILIVEDEFIQARDLELLLTDLGYAVVGIAATGADALALAEREHPDLVLMDIHLQGHMDGIAAAHDIHRRWRLPVVFLTAYADEDTLQRAVSTEPFGYIVKPFEKRELRTLIEIALYKHQTEEQLRHSAEQYRAVIETSPDGFWIVDLQGRLLEVNEAYVRLSGYSRDELLAMTISDLDASETSVEMLAHIEKVRRAGNDLFLTQHRAKSGRIWQAEVSTCFWPSAGDRFFVFIRDICQRQRAEMLLKIRLRLSQVALNGSLDRVLQTALDEAERLTGSTIGFFHFVESDQERLTLQTWSSHTLAICQASGQGLHYPVSQAGVWADCLRLRRPVVHNDYQRLPNPRGLPDGHVMLLRELTLPIMAEGRVVAIMGVGNKPEDYTDEDVAVLQQLTELIMDVIERKRTQDRMEHLAYHDALTQLPNRILLADRLQQAMAQTRRDRKRLAVCYLDLDGFKPINDIHGHEQGDQVLIEVARRLKQCIRAGDTVARLGGDEFVLLLAELADVEECERAIDRVLAALQIPFTVAGQPASLSASIGVTLYPDDSADPDILLRHVDQAMYAAKQAGGRRYQWFGRVGGHPGNPGV